MRIVAAATILLAGCAGVQRSNHLPALSTEDIAEIGVVLLVTALEHYGTPGADSTRIWLEIVERGASEASAPPGTMLAALTASYPGVRGLERTDYAYLCPPGVHVLMPGQGCPIRDGGIIVTLGVMEPQADGTVSTTVGVTQTDTQSGATWNEGFEVILNRNEATGWVASRTGLSWIS